MTGHFLHSCGPRTRILGKIPACHEKGREREQRSAGQVISCLDIPSRLPVASKQSLYLSEICKLRLLGRVGLPGCWELLQDLVAGLWSPVSPCLAPRTGGGGGGGGQVLSSLPMAAWILDDDIRASQQAH